MKIAFVHPGRQTARRKIEALCLGGHAVTFYTTIHSSSRLWAYLSRIPLLNMLMPTNFIRKDNELNHENLTIVATSQVAAVLLRIALYFSKSKRIYDYLNHLHNKIFAKTVATHVIRKNYDIVISMSAASLFIFQELRDKEFVGSLIFDTSSASYQFNCALEKQIYKNKSSRGKIKRLTQYAKVYELSDLILCTSQFVKWSLTAFGVPNRKIKVINYGADLWCPLSCDHDKKRSEFCAHSENLKLLFVGDISKLKGVDKLIDVFGKLNFNNIELHLAGRIVDADLLDSIKSDSRIKYHGFVGQVELQKLYVNSDLFVFLTLTDSFGTVITEALTYRLPVLTVETCGASDVIVDGKNGWILKDDSMSNVLMVLNNLLKRRSVLQLVRAQMFDSFQLKSWSDYYVEYNGVISNVRSHACNSCF